MKAVDAPVAPDETTGQLLERAREIFAKQAAAIAKLGQRIDGSFEKATELLYATEGHVVLSGLGKSGIIGHKIAATLASTGMRALFMHSAEAYHGDLGMMGPGDTAVLISRSGETEEVNRLIPHLQRMEIPIIALVGALGSTLAREATVTLDVSVDEEVCPNNLAPTTSTLATLAMGDALAVALIQRRGFGALDFARFHPGGRLGHKLLTRVKDSMRKEKLPIVAPGCTVGDTLLTMTDGRLGMVLVMENKRLVGVVTDGDLRRAMQKHEKVLTLPIESIMTSSPITVRDDVLQAEADEQMRRRKLKAIIAVNAQGEVTGVLDVFMTR